MIPRPPPHLLSVELLASRATVVIGDVVKAEGGQVTFLVRDVLKGTPAKEYALRMDAPSSSDFQRWQTSGARLLVTDPNAYQVRESLDLSSPGAGILTQKLRLIQGPEAIVKAVRDAIRTTKKASAAAKPFELPLRPTRIAEAPPDTRAWLEKLRYLPILDVPVDALLEALGQREVHADDPNRRLDGVRALTHFFSPTDERLLQERLSDSGWRPVYSVDQNQVRRVEVNDVRAEAFRALQSYGKWVWPPETERPKEERERVIAIQRFAGGPFYRFSDYPNLVTLDLAGAPLTENQCGNIGQAFGLKALFFEGSSVTDAAMAQLVGDRGRAYGLRYLEMVDVAFTKVTDTGLMEFTRLPSLKRLFVGHGATAAGLAAVRKARPDLAVEEDPFAFLEPFRPRRIPQSYGSLYGMYGRGDRDLSRIRECALVFPKETADGAMSAMDRELVRRGWSKFYAGYNQGADGRVFTQFQYELEGVVLAPGERLVVVTWNAAL